MVRMHMEGEGDVLPALLFNIAELLRRAHEIAESRKSDTLIQQVKRCRSVNAQTISVALLGKRENYRLNDPVIIEGPMNCIVQNIDQLIRVRKVFPTLKHPDIQVLYRLLHDPGRIVANKDLQRVAGGRANDNCLIINICVYRLRKDLARHGVVDSIIAERGGYSISEDKALDILNLLNRND